MSSIIIRIATAAAIAATTGVPAAHAYRQSGTYTPRVEGAGENQSAVPLPLSMLGAVQPRAIISGTGENLSVEHLGAPAPAPEGYVARITGGGENISVEHVPAGG